MEEWVGPVTHIFKYDRKHTVTTRYKLHLKSHDFDLYTPDIIIPGLYKDGIPEKLIVTIGKPTSDPSAKGYWTNRRQCMVFDFYEEKVNSVRYMNKSQDYSVYVQNEIFEGKQYPQDIFLHINRG